MLADWVAASSRHPQDAGALSRPPGASVEGQEMVATDLLCVLRQISLPLWAEKRGEVRG